ncbi:MAG: hypothetical protein JWM80_3253 [Cyanobacteria bacterium RYN_339]|nr:hypothetical protein [Cyanobacteria bacterium RYN_339]
MLKPVDGQAAPNLSSSTLGPGAAPAAPTVKFATAMQTTQNKVAQDTMVAFLAEIDEQGKRLMKHPIRAEVERYRALVGKFVKEASAQMTTMEKRTDRRNRAFTLIKEIDKKLAELTQLMIDGQAKQLDVLAKLQEIHGMLVDLKI